MSINPSHEYAPAVLEAFRGNLVSYCVEPPKTISNEWIQGFRYAIAFLEDQNAHTAANLLEDSLESGAGSNRIECPNHEGQFDCTPFCALCEGNQDYLADAFIRCVNCPTLITKATYAEELGFCVECSNAYYTEKENN